jgi:hypothetical protein
MNIINQLEVFLKNKKNLGIVLPEIRYFDGIGAFCTIDGRYKATSLDEALKLFLRDNTN